jgi:UDP-N-acetylmuramoyl-L-alanyl-D-glutamate--2,6-diaminopimelate ligase
MEIADLAEHNADVTLGCGFVAVADATASRSAHIQAAMAAGASIILIDERHLQDSPSDIDVVAVRGLADQRGALAARFYGDPSRKLNCTGVTGTNGKTSIAYHIADLITAMGAQTGQRCGYSGTLGWGLLEELADPDLTTTNAVALQRRLAKLVTDGCTHASIEVSSHALDQGRVDAVHFTSAVFSNLTRDHLDYHGSMEAYAAAKARLFTEFQLDFAIVSTSSPFGETLAAMCPAQTITYGPGGDVTWQTTPTDDGLAIRWSTPWGACEAELAVVADFSIANITAALATLVSQGEVLDQVCAMLPNLTSVPGRLEVVAGPSRDKPTVIVDYAHTPDALEKVLLAMRGFCSGNVVCVIGCGGDRDRGKRPLMAAAAARHADRVWLTSDNPRSEDPAAIIRDMRDGLGAQTDLPGVVSECLDRGEAICRALRDANPGDVVLIAGKGHETYQEITGVKYDFDDAYVANNILEGIG